MKRSIVVSVLAVSLLVAGFAVVRAALTLDATSVVSDGAITLKGAAGSPITIGDTAQTGAVTIASSSQALTVDVGGGAGAKTINIGRGAANTIRVGTTTPGTALSLDDDNWQLTDAGAATLVSMNLGTTALQDVISATTSLNFGAAASPNSCQEQDKAVTGAAQGDSVMVSPGNFNPAAHHLFYAFGSSTNAVTIRDCYATSTAPTDPDGGAGSPFYRITIFKF